MKNKRKHPALGILFKGEMVRAIQSGVKTQTRRTMHPQPVEIDDYEGTALLFDSDADDAKPLLIGDKPFKPKYQVGDILYVKETYATFHGEYVYRADIDSGKMAQEVARSMFGNWKPSLLMPYNAARIFLKVTDVRVERLNDINGDDAIAEGIEQKNGHWIDYHDKDRFTVFMDTSNVRFPGESAFWPAEVASYRTLWETINGAKSWLDNPGVWVYTFERTEKPA